MRIHNEYLTLPTKQKRAFHNITENVKLALEKNGIRDGMILVTTLHTNAAVLLNDGEPGLFQDVEAWLDQLAPLRDDYKHGAKFESNAGAHLQSLLLDQ